MTQAVLKTNGKLVPRKTLQRLTILELNLESKINKIRLFDEAIHTIYGESLSVPEIPNNNDAAEIYFMIDYDEQTYDIPKEDPVDEIGKAIFQKPLNDMLIHAEVIIPKRQGIKCATLKGIYKYPDGNIIRNFNENLIINSIVYNVELPSGLVKQYVTNNIAENIYTQVDQKFHSHNLLDTIIYYYKDGHSVSNEDKYVITRSGNRRLRKTTIGWKLSIKWKYETKEQVPLKLIQESKPVKVSDISMARDIVNEPELCWWVPYNFQKRDRIIAAVNYNVRKATHKYGIEVLTSMYHANKMD